MFAGVRAKTVMFPNVCKLQFAGCKPLLWSMQSFMVTHLTSIKNNRSSRLSDSSVGSAGAPRTEAVSWLWCPGFDSTLSPFAVCHFLSFSPTSCPLFSCFNKNKGTNPPKIS